MHTACMLMCICTFHTGMTVLSPHMPYVVAGLLCGSAPVLRATKCVSELGSLEGPYAAAALLPAVSSCLTLPYLTLLAAALLPTVSSCMHLACIYASDDICASQGQVYACVCAGSFIPCTCMRSQTLVHTYQARAWVHRQLLIVKISRDVC